MPGKPTAVTVVDELRKYARLKNLARTVRRGESGWLGTTDVTDLALRREAFSLDVAKANFIRTCRRILIEDARVRGREKHGAHLERTPLTESALSRCSDVGLSLELLDALDGLRSVDPEAADGACLRLGAGLDRLEIARHTHRSIAQVDKKWGIARAYLSKSLQAAR